MCYPLSRQLRLTHRFLRLQPLRTWLVRAGSRKRPPWTPYAITEYSRSLSTVQQGCLLPPTQPNPTWFVCGPSTQQATPSPCSPITPTAHPSHWIDTVFRIRFTRLLYYCVLQDVYHSVYTSTAVGHITMSMYLYTCTVGHITMSMYLYTGTVGHITSSLSLSNTLITPLQCHTHTQYTLPPPRKPPDKLSPLPYWAYWSTHHSSFLPQTQFLPSYDVFCSNDHFFLDTKYPVELELHALLERIPDLVIMRLQNVLQCHSKGMQGVHRARSINHPSHALQGKEFSSDNSGDGPSKSDLGALRTLIQNAEPPPKPMETHPKGRPPDQKRR